MRINGLLGPCGAGILYVRRDLQDMKLTPPIYGWHNVRNPNFVAQEQIVFRKAVAVKYEAGTHNLLGLVGMIAALRKIALEIGVDNVAR